MSSDRNNKPGYIPKEKRKTILLMCDDIRTHSGIGTIGKEIVLGTAHHFNWINLGGAVQHPEMGRKIDVSDMINKLAGISDSSVLIYPVSGYGNQSIVRKILQMHQEISAIMIFTDPRYWVWFFRMENEIRRKIPICYLNIWDDAPVPRWNREFYRSCDLIMNISKQTYNLVKRCVHDSENVISLHSSDRMTNQLNINNFK